MICIKETCCQKCRRAITESSLGRPKKWCSSCVPRRAGESDKAHKCERCGKEWFGRKKRFCSNQCSARGRHESERRQCDQCGKSISGGHSLCVRCAQLQRHRNAGTRKLPRACRGCGNAFVPRATGNAGKYCSRECAFASQKRLARLNREASEINAAAAAVADGCLTWLSRSRQRSECDICGRDFFSPYKTAITCRNPGCKHQNALQYYTPPTGKCRRCGRAYKRSLSQPSNKCAECSLEKNRKRKRAVTRYLQWDGGSYERIRKQDVFDSCLWMCGICGGRVDHWRKHPDKLAAQMDHIVPLCNGGTHERSNVQCTHAICNAAKRSDTQDEAARGVRLALWITGCNDVHEMINRSFLAR